ADILSKASEGLKPHSLRPRNRRHLKHRRLPKRWPRNLKHPYSLKSLAAPQTQTPETQLNKAPDIPQRTRQKALVSCKQSPRRLMQTVSLCLLPAKLTVFLMNPTQRLN